MDRITITIEKDIELPGGGTVVDRSIAELAAGPDGTPLLDVVTAAFADAYGVHSLPDPADPESEPIPVSVYKNVSYQIRQFITGHTLAFAGRQIDAGATTQKNATSAAALGAVLVAEAE
jgi:hypothetical protein